MSNVHPSAVRGFSKGAETYSQGRPDYPPDVDVWLSEKIGLGPGASAVDLGAGTGKFTGRLIGTGADVVAVDPVSEMLERLVQAHPGVEARVGSAQAIPLDDASVDAVVCAQSFHWFATSEALAEIRRVLKPGGRLGLVWNVRDHSVPWVARFTAMLDVYNADARAPRYHLGQWRQPFPAEGFGPLESARFAHGGHMGAPEDVIVKRGLSVSFIAALPDDVRARVAAEIRGLISETPELAGRDRVSFPYVTEAYSCVKT